MKDCIIESHILREITICGFIFASLSRAAERPVTTTTTSSDLDCIFAIPKIESILFMLFTLIIRRLNININRRKPAYVVELSAV